jgi:hypothetical protein
MSVVKKQVQVRRKATTSQFVANIPIFPSPYHQLSAQWCFYRCLKSYTEPQGLLPAGLCVDLVTWLQQYLDGRDGTYLGVRNLAKRPAWKQNY